MPTLSRPARERRRHRVEGFARRSFRTSLVRGDGEYLYSLIALQFEHGILRPFPRDPTESLIPSSAHGTGVGPLHSQHEPDEELPNAGTATTLATAWEQGEVGMAQQIPLSSGASAVDPALDAARNDSTHEIAPDLAYRRLGIVNVVFIGPPGAGDRGWVLVDAGLIGTKGLIASAAEKRFGKDARPAAILMTHGHFDHVGALEDLSREWDAPVYAHQLEIPYLDGSESYPPGDPSVGGGMMAALARFYPRGPV